MVPVTTTVGMEGLWPRPHLMLCAVRYPSRKTKT